MGLEGRHCLISQMYAYSSIAGPEMASMPNLSSLLILIKMSQLSNILALVQQRETAYHILHDA